MASINFLIHGVLGRWFGRTSHNRGSIMHVLSVILCNTFLFFFLYRKDPGGNTAPLPISRYFGDAIKGRRILMIWELLSCNFWGIFNHLESPGDLKGKHPETNFLWQIASSCFISFSNHYYWKLRYRWHWVIGFHFILFFSHPSLFSSVLTLPPHLLIFPSHIVLQTPPQSSLLPSYMYPVHPSSPRSSVDCRGRHWTVNLTLD